MNDYSIFQGQHSVDLSSLQGKLIDLTPAQRRNLRTELSDFIKAKHELRTQFPQLGPASGIPQDAFDEFVEHDDIIEKIDEKLADAKKLVEVLEETRAYHVHARQNNLSLVADALQSKARRKQDPSILAPFVELLKYVAQVGVKAAKTRKKNEAANTK